MRSFNSWPKSERPTNAMIRRIWTMKNNWIKTVTLLTSLSVGMSGCENYPEVVVPPNKTAPSDGYPISHEYALRVFVGQQGEPQRVVNVLPADLPSEPIEEPVSEGEQPALGERSAAPSSPGLRIQATVQTDGGTAIDTNEQDEADDTVPGATLLAWAARSCETLDNYVTGPEGVEPFAIGTPWTGNAHASWYIFHGSELEPGQNWNCDRVLYYQEVLLCAADRLAELAEGVGTVSWNTFNEGSSTPVVVTVPPQGTEDKFIARDIAINALAHVAKLESKVVTDGSVLAVCSNHYETLAKNGNYTLPPAGFSRAVPRNTVYFDNPSVNMVSATVSERKAVGVARLERQANILSAAGRLLKQLIDDSVRDDVSGAQQQLAASGGNAKRAWGVDENQSPYNTLRHAYRILMGRLEIGRNDPSSLIWSNTPGGPSLDDPRCGSPGFEEYAIDLLPNIGYGESARWSGASPRTRGEVLAMTLFDRAGIVIPRGVTSATLLGVTPEQLRQAAIAELIRDAAQRQGLTLGTTMEFNDFKASPSGQAIVGLFELPSGEQTVSTEEILFAMDRVEGTFRQIAGYSPMIDNHFGNLTNVANSLAGAATLSGLVVGASTPEVTAVGGIVIEGGLPRKLLSHDYLPRAMHAQQTGQCGTPWDSGTPIDFAMGPDSFEIQAFQNVFFLGEVFRRRLGNLAGLAEGTVSLDSLGKFADAAAAELREWTGPGSILRHFDQGSTGTTDDRDRYYLMNFRLSDLDVGAVTELSTRLVVVQAINPYPQGVRIECLTGQRTCTPPSYDLPESVIEYDDLLDSSARGLDTSVLRVTYPHSDYDQYLVLLPGGSSPGKVLAFLRGTFGALPSQAPIFREVVSDYQRSLLNKVMGVQQVEKTERSCTNITQLALPQEYCIEGMERDQFVPLENELTSAGAEGEDSWRHYLTLAEESAAKTDELGRQMIEVGLSRDLRSEAAVEAFGELCGVFPGDVADLSFAEGQVDEVPVSDAVNECIGATTTDIVFLRDDPYAALEPQDAEDDICATYCETVNGPRLSFCEKCDDPEAMVTHAGLGFWNAVFEDTPPVEEACADVLRGFDPFTSQFDAKAFGSVADQTWASSQTFANLIASMKLTEDEEGEWMLTVHGTPLLGTRPIVAGVLAPPEATPTEIDEAVAGVWPACLQATCSNAASFIGDFFPTVSPYSMREEVERMVFYLGAMAGGIPPGVIEMPIPVANRTALGETHPVATPALYAASHFTPVVATEPEGAYQLTEDGYDGYWELGQENVHLMGKVIALQDPAFWDDRNDSGPEWRRYVYDEAQALSSGNGYLAAITTNSHIPFDAALSPGKPGGRETLASWLKSISIGYQGSYDGLSALWALRQAAYYSGPPSGLAGEVPESAVCQFNGGQGGRHVCFNAPLKPLFFTAPLENIYSCGNKETLATRLVSTTTVIRTNDEGSANMNAIVGESGNALCYASNAGGLEAFGGCQVQWVWGVPATCAEPEWILGTPGIPTCEYVSWHTEFASGANSDFLDWPMGAIRRVAHDRTLPRYCSPSDRVEMFMETDLTDDAHAMSILTKSLALSCVTTHGLGHESFEEIPRPIEKVSDIAYLEGWVGQLANVTRAAASSIVLVDVPTSVVDNVTKGAIGTDNVGKGTRGDQLLELEEHLRTIEKEFSGLGTTFSLLRGEIALARTAVESASLQSQQQALGLAAQRLENQRQMAISSSVITNESLNATLANFTGMNGDQAALAGVGLGVALAATGGTGAGVVAGGYLAKGLFTSIGAGAAEAEEIERAQMSLDIFTQVDANLETQLQLTQALEGNQITAVLGGLGQQTTALYQSIQDHVTGIQNSTSDALQVINGLKQTESNARISLAKASGADFVAIGTETVPLHVNTVYRRQFDVLKERYRRSLESSKRAAYLARLAVEERLGTRMDDLTSSIGPLEAPSLWVDDLCTVQGIDYDALRTADPNTGSVVDGSGVRGIGSEDGIDVISGYADQYVGDYVAKLKEFVEFYNIEFPFREADDSALISLREDLQDPSERCIAESRNQLYFSGSLETSGTDMDGGGSFAGWNVSGCDPDACLSVVSGAGLQNPDGMETVVLDSPVGGDGVSWVRTSAIRDLAEPLSNGIPTGMVYQSVELRGGTSYVLSWWDMARDDDGGPYSASSDPPEYAVSVFDKNWAPIGVQYLMPAKSGSAGTSWSERHAIEIVAPTDGIYHLGFTAAPVGTSGASLAIANVQLEESSGNTAEPSAYESVGPDRQVLTGNCSTLSPEQFRGRFVYQCDEAACYHVLKQPLIIDSQLLNQGRSSLVGKVAANNYNYRHVSLAVNLVGTGVTDCGDVDASSCYGQGYIEYDLEHFARNIPIEDYLETTRCFDFGVGHVRSGKALATERFLTLPLGSADAELISQNAFLRGEMTGRPLSGTYTLRIKDTPRLSWQNVDDVQILVNYRYWSRVDVDN
jgi:hypothetical protein